MQLEPADIIYSRYIRTRDNWTCQRCLRQFPEGSQGLHNSHFYGRVNRNLRFDDFNCTALCYGCHKFFDEKNREAYRDFKIKQIGQAQFVSLKIRAEIFKKKDKKLELIIAKAKLTEIIISQTRKKNGE